MKAEIVEHINKSDNWITFTLRKGKSLVLAERFEGDGCDNSLIDFLESEKEILSQVKHISCYRTNKDLEHLKYFPSIECLNVRGGKSELRFPSLDGHIFLEQIHINDQAKETKLFNIDTAIALQRIFIGDFTFGKPVTLSNFDCILLCPKLESLYFSNAKFEEHELSKLTQLKTLTRLTLNQKYEVQKLAELSVLLPNIECEELKPWQKCESSNGDIKINGKRRPYLNSKADQKRIRKYEIEFERLQKIYAE